MLRVSAILSNYELIRDVFLWTPTYGHTSVGRPAKYYIHLHCVNTGCNLEDLPSVVADMDGWPDIRESVLSTQFNDDDDNNIIQTEIYLPYHQYWALFIHNACLGPVGKVFGNDPGNLGSIPGWVIPKTLKNGAWYHLA